MGEQLPLAHRIKQEEEETALEIPQHQKQPATRHMYLSLSNISKLPKSQVMSGKENDFWQRNIEKRAQYLVEGKVSCQNRALLQVVIYVLPDGHFF